MLVSQLPLNLSKCIFKRVISVLDFWNGWSSCWKPAKLKKWLWTSGGNSRATSIHSAEERGGGASHGLRRSSVSPATLESRTSPCCRSTDWEPAQRGGGGVPSLRPFVCSTLSVKQNSQHLHSSWTTAKPHSPYMYIVFLYLDFTFVIFSIL